MVGQRPHPHRTLGRTQFGGSAGGDRAPVDNQELGRLGRESVNFLASEAVDANCWIASLPTQQAIAGRGEFHPSRGIQYRQPCDMDWLAAVVGKDRHDAVVSAAR